MIDRSAREHAKEGISQELEELYLQADAWDLKRFESSYDENLRARVSASLLGPEIDTVLDVGCGNGFVTGHFKNSKVVGVDPSHVALRKFSGNCVLALGNNLPFPDHSFDAVCCLEVLEHLESPVYEGTISELNRVAKKTLLVSVPYKQDLRREMIRCKECRLKYHVDLHRHEYNDPESVR